jgi:ribose-phosphate pyrophosphokinase
MSKVSPLGDDFKLFCGRANPDLGKEIAEILSVSLGKIRISTFADSEIHVQIDESIRGKDIYIVQSTCEPVNENLMELLVMLDAFRRASAHQITAIIPYYGYARQDHKSTGREPISAKLVADLITTAGANRVVSVDLHATQIQGFFNIPMDHLTAVPILANYFKENTLEDAVIVSPDVGRAKLADKYTDILHLPMALMNKRRSGVGGSKVEFLEIVGDVEGKTPILIDDVIASGSIARQAEELVKAGSKEAYIAITHPVLVGPAMERIQSPAVKELIVTNTIPVPEEKRLGGKVKVLSIAPLLAKAIQRVHQHLSVSQVFMEENILFPV